MEHLSFVKSGREGEFPTQSLSEIYKSLPPGQYDIFVVRKEYRVSVRQLRLFWMWMTHLEKWSGQSRVDWHDHFVGRYLFTDSTKELTSVQMNDFLAHVQADVQTEYGQTLPLPNDESFNEFCFEYRDK